MDKTPPSPYRYCDVQHCENYLKTIERERERERERVFNSFNLIGIVEEPGTELSLPPVTRAKRVSRLRAGTRYEVRLAAVYEGLFRVAAPPFSVATASLPADQPAPPCECSDTGAVALCPPEPGANCSCLPGYTGPRCDLCLPGYYRAAMDRCVECPCPNTTSTGDCELRRSSSQPADGGSVPLLAVLATLGVLLLAVGLGSCYRYWSHQRHRPRLPLWSMELQSPPTSAPPLHDDTARL
ncbi:MEGF9 [Cordylochernes scorpioides]|uniref:MEGF9 n=1 Tax=Cordylochernes scorpioides TaxID=51811 RepID=A0ABY6KJD5_9ARAC|nr:MEGF9 [Cordylochernes scorpioides]